ncbi:MAG: TonB-dependent receptor [Alteromonadaceae bacterium]|nr:TonB-dependent receptor [Alteromonadaceae bacterium]
MKTHRLSRITGALVLALGLTTSAMANETSSGISGKILNPTGQAAPNTTIIVTHIPTGATKTVVTNDSGSYNIRGLRVGGPYKVVIDSDDFKDQKHAGIYLEVGKQFRLSTNLDVDNIERIAVTGSKISGFTNSGSSGSWGADEIIKAAGGNRDLKDILRSNPLVTIGTGSDAEMSIAGTNPRFNSFTVDGVKQNDDFGLNKNGYPTQRSPISIDAIEQVSVETSPFSVRNGGFSGGQINAVTKSGTNEFHGTLSYEKDSDSWAGTPKDLYGNDAELEFESTTYAATIGGPIIENKLFFFASYENFDRPTSVEWGPADASGANKAVATLDQYNRIREIAQSVYGVDPGTWDARPEETDEKILVKVDWNINDDHRAAFTYQNTEGNVTRNMSTKKSELKLSSHWYNKNEKLETFAAHFYSDWSDNFSSEIKLAWKDVETEQASNNKLMGDVTVDVTDHGESVTFGSDKYRHGNALSNETFSFRALGEYLYDDHEISFGVEYDTISVINLFVPSSLGEWGFDSIDDFENREASYMAYANAYTNNQADAEARFTFVTTTFFIEDSFDLTDEIRVTAGLRYETISSDDEPTHNTNFEARYGFSNSESLDGESILLPRVGIEWQATDDIIVRGGIGKFSGGKPNVWLSNAYSNDGITNVSANNVSDYLSNVDITQVPQGVLDGMVSGDGNTNVTDPNLKLPTDWRSSVSLDYTFSLPELGDDWLWTAEFIYVDKEDDLFWQDLTRQFVGTTAAGRKLYQPIDVLTGEATQRFDILMKNANKDGDSKIFTTSLSKYFDNGFGFNASYTNQNVTEGTPGTSSTSMSNFKYPVMVDRNHAQLGPGSYEIEHAFKLNINYSHEFIENYATAFNLFFERRSGRPISWILNTYKNAQFGDQTEFYKSSTYLPYIPTGADDPNVVLDGTDWNTFSTFLDETGLTQYAGGYAPKGSGRAPWITRMDLTITQELPGFMEGHKGEFFLSIKNLLNMIDHSKGQAVRSEYGTHYVADASIDDQGRYVYEEPYNDFSSKNYSMVDIDESAWAIKMGVRYRF